MKFKSTGFGTNRSNRWKSLQFGDKYRFARCKSRTHSVLHQKSKHQCSSFSRSYRSKFGMIFILTYVSPIYSIRNLLHKRAKIYAVFLHGQLTKKHEKLNKKMQIYGKFTNSIKSINKSLKKIYSFQNINVKVTNADNTTPLLEFSASYPDHLNTPHVVDASCKTNKKSDFVCRIALSTENAALLQIQSGIYCSLQFYGIHPIHKTNLFGSLKNDPTHDTICIKTSLAYLSH